jgi:hypothetical protein
MFAGLDCCFKMLRAEVRGSSQNYDINAGVQYFLERIEANKDVLIRNFYVFLIFQFSPAFINAVLEQVAQGMDN